MTKPMTKMTQPGARKESAFTLIELIVVIGIITVLAALTFPVATGIREGATRRKVKTELQRVATAIESYKAKYGFYPPDNPRDNPNNYLTGYRTNQLYFELSGSTLRPPAFDLFQTLDGSAEISTNAVSSVFGVSGFVNCMKGSGSDDAPSATAFLKGMKPNQYAEIGPNVRVLTCSEPGAGTAINPWRYNSSNPINNPNSYDLWVDVLIGGKTNRISNWSEQPQFVN